MPRKHCAICWFIHSLLFKGQTLDGQMVNGQTVISQTINGQTIRCTEMAPSCSVTNTHGTPAHCPQCMTPPRYTRTLPPVHDTHDAYWFSWWCCFPLHAQLDHSSCLFIAPQSCSKRLLGIKWLPCKPQHCLIDIPPLLCAHGERWCVCVCGVQQDKICNTHTRSHTCTDVERAL